MQPRRRKGALMSPAMSNGDIAQDEALGDSKPNCSSDC